MAKVIESLYNIRILEELSEKRTAIHNIHPLAKVLTTFIFLIVTVSFEKYEVSTLLPLIFYPVVIMNLADIPLKPIFKRLAAVSPFIIIIGIFNPLFNSKSLVVLPWLTVSAGWVSFISILLKGLLTVMGAFILIATTGMTKIAYALTIIRIPKVFILQLILTYRYISVLAEEVARTLCAYSLRSPFTKGVRFREWGSLTGQLIIRTLDRAKRIYNSMCCRGFTGEYSTGNVKKMKLSDIAYLAGWSIYFLIIRYVDVPAIIGLLITGSN